MSATSTSKRRVGEAGRPYGHVPGHHYLDVEVAARQRRGHWTATATVTHGSAQGSHDTEEVK